MIVKKLLTASVLIVMAGFSYSQNWTTHCGNNERNGQSPLPGPQALHDPVWTVTNATQTALGMNLYSFGNRFVTSRVDFSPYYALIECRDLTDGSLLWTSPDLGPQSILYAMGFNEDAVYAHDYHSSLFYALDPSDGSVKWVYDGTSYTFGPMDGVIYTCERDVIINGALGAADASTICLDKENGEVLWANANWFAVTPNETKAAHGDKLYLITGAINQPKQLVAVDIRTGESLYYSEELPGDADQEGPMAISPDGTIYFRRDGGDLFAVDDNGGGFTVRWTYTPINMGLFVVNHCVDYDGNLLILDNDKVYRLDKTDGSIIDSSNQEVGDAGRITLGADSLIFINNAAGGYYALNYDLQFIFGGWYLIVNGNTYAGPALMKNGYMVFCGMGFNIKAYRYEGDHKPVSDFTASAYKTEIDDFIDFTDQSSFQPTSWHWEFPGAVPSVSTEQNPTGISYPVPGIYDVKLIATNELGSDTLIKNCLVEVVNTIGVDEPGKEMDFSIWPNPAKDVVNIYSAYPANIQIVDMFGRAHYTDAQMQLCRQVNIADLPGGMYIVKFLDEQMEHKGSGRILVTR